MARAAEVDEGRLGDIGHQHRAAEVILSITFQVIKPQSTSAKVAE
jgi:hypothetical protein